MRPTFRALPVLVCILTATALAPAARADRALLSEAALETTSCIHCGGGALPQTPPTDGQIEGPCGLAVSPDGMVHLADYYHRAIDTFKMPTVAAPGKYEAQFVLPGSNPDPGFNTLDAVCGIAFDSAGNLYGNEWHQSVRDLSGETAIDTGESTGLAIDPSSDRLYVDDRTYVAEYALPFSPGDEPLAKIGLGSLGEGFGLAAAAGRVYVADAADQAVKVFQPATSLTDPVAVISGQFSSLTEAALAIDPTNGHLLVVDNLQPGFEHPKSAVREFASAGGGYDYLGALPGAPVDGGPSGIAVNSGGEAIVTDGNSELANAFLYGPYEASALAAVPGPAPDAYAGPPSATSAGAGAGAASKPRPGAASASEVGQSGGVRVSFQGNLAPRALPRHGSRPVVARVGARVVPLHGRTPPQLRRIEIAVNRHGRFLPGALPVCHLADIQPATTTAALAACRRSLVGEGSFSARVLIPEQAPFPSSGRVYAFNARWHGRPAIFAHVYGTEPLPISYTLAFELLPRRGTFGTLLRASVPAVAGNSAYITSLSLAFGGGPRARGYVRAGCPAPAGIREAVFSFARVDFSFAGNRKVGSTLVRSCRARG